MTNKKADLVWEHFPVRRHDGYAPDSIEMWKARCGRHLFIIEKWVDLYWVTLPVKWEEDCKLETLEAAKALCQEWREEAMDE